MPKSKRNKLVELSETKKHGLEGKKRLYQKIQSNVDSYTHVLVFSVNDMRNSKMKNVREQWKHSRFCIGKNRVMAKALGRTEEEEYRPNLHKIGQQLKGEKGLLFTNQPVEEVVNWFRSYSDGDYARSGNIATEDVFLSEGPLKQFPHNQEAYLRQLGLPTTLQKGVVHLIKDHVVCHAGERLSPETARILKLLGYEMAEFRIRIESVWSQNGMFIEFNSETKENEGNNLGSFMKEGFELSSDVANLGNEEEMECDLNEVPSNTPKKSELTEKKIEASEEEPKKFSPKLTRSRAAASNIKVKTPDSNVVIEPRSARKRKL
ncbi:mRNA turnover protein 4 homolog [Nephila pilipes]|uniref:Ribosome assembly factor mrt4 n=1 Tax=Nephila pilipes TaxID=299642 RepID=A0A8X6NDV8_NEPPI|nr:mRNA turnover protein 4 homolog [Nephila pilipes]